MSSGESSKRLQRAKSAVTHRRTSADSIKTDIRNKFIERLRKSRSKSVDRVRAALKDDREYESLDEIRNALLADKEAADLINSEEITDIMRQLHEEMEQLSLQNEADSYMMHNESEANETAERLMTQCPICQGLSVHAVCEKCNFQLNSEFRE
ncbi:uncharacterized protein LOC143196899 [Rhynchophorus ferrugineus]|uniref:Uncharacterized protein n=1 Tax=Rhynchophorus ferrugineus TaxID=354439 RepID=A0A834HWR9_RHYFE|nr:hypothetical protein GWI33_017450 [Rhynchophorus ferrugineus]